MRKWTKLINRLLKLSYEQRSWLINIIKSINKFALRITVFSQIYHEFSKMNKSLYLTSEIKELTTIKVSNAVSRILISDPVLIQDLINSSRRFKYNIAEEVTWYKPYYVLISLLREGSDKKQEKTDLNACWIDNKELLFDTIKKAYNDYEERYDLSFISPIKYIYIDILIKKKKIF